MPADLMQQEIERLCEQAADDADFAEIVTTAKKNLGLVEEADST